MTPKKFALKNLALIPSWECDIACHHCVFESSPKVKGILDITKAKALITDLSRISNLEVVTISGGEPFLHPDYLIEIAAHCRQLDLIFRVITNASFALTTSIATKILEQLRDIGLQSVGISWDKFHSQFIEGALVANAIRACRNLNIPVQMTCVVTKDSTLSAALEALGDEGYELRSLQVKCLPVGRAVKKIDPDSLLPPSDWEKARACRSDFDTLAVIHDGTVYPCCAVGGFTDGISLGRLDDESIHNLLERRDTDLRWTVLAANGPQFFMNYATTRELVKIGASKNLHDCVNCNRIFNSPIGEILVNRAAKDIKRQTAALMIGCNL